MAGLEPAPQGLEGPQATVTPHSPWFGLWYQSLIPRPNTDRWRSPAQELLSVVKDPCSFELVGGKGFEPNRSLGENGFTARQRTIHSYRPCWRQRQDSNPDPRGLEARMLPLHHAVVPLSRLGRFRDKTSP